VRVTPATLCAVMHLKDLRRMSNLREDTLGQVLGNANVLAGLRVLVADGGPPRSAELSVLPPRSSLS
jgi:hypothetical protein